jgi:flagellin
MRHIQKTGDDIAAITGRLSSGLRINKASDDASGMFVSEQLRSQIATLKQANQNIAQAGAFVQTVEGGLEQLTGILTRLKGLAIRAADGSASDDIRERGIQVEADELISEIDRMVESIRYAGTTLFPETETRITFQVGETSSDRIGLTLSGLNKDMLLGAFATKVGFIAASSSLTAAAGFDVSATGALTANTATEGDMLRQLAGGDLVQFSGLEFFVESVTDNDNAQLNMTLEGKMNLTLDNDVVRGVGTKFTKQLRAGDTFDMTINNATQTFTVASVDSDTQLTLTAAVSSTELGNLKMFTGDADGDLGSVAITAIGVGNSDQAGQYLQLNGIQDFLDQIASGIDTIIAQRARLGAVQARIERAASTHSVQIENLTNAESVIRDADMAVEISALVRAQVLAQTGTSILNVANLQPQTVLNLLAALG